MFVGNILVETLKFHYLWYVSSYKVRTWVISMAFTLVFGGMFTKMWRVYSIVIYNKTKRKVRSEQQNSNTYYIYKKTSSHIYQYFAS